MDLYNYNPQFCENAELAKQWIEGMQNYIPPEDKNGKKNIGYYTQEVEADAYVFAYAVIKYKYGDIEELIPKELNNEEFFERVDKQIKVFKKKGI